MAEKDYHVNINLNGNELKQSSFEKLASAPLSPFLGQNYYDTTLNINRHWNGTEWLSGGSEPDPDTVIDADYVHTDNNYTDAEVSKLAGIATGATANDTDANLKARANHTGTQAATTITEDSTHRFATDAEKSTWNAKQDALGFTPENAANKNQISGYAGLDGAGLIPSALLPSFVDDVLEYADLASFPVSGETGKIYIAIDTGKSYRWSGSIYVEITASPGSTDEVTEGSLNLYFTAARVLATVLTGLSTATNAVITAADSVLSALGKLQKQISDNLTTLTSHTSNTSNPHSVTQTQVGLSNVDNTSDTNKPVSTAQQTAISAVAFWRTLPGTPVRVSNTSFTITDSSNTNLYNLMFGRLTIIKWTDTSVTKFAMVTVASYAADTITFTIIGDTLASSATMSTIKYSIQKCKPIIFAIAGTIATGTDLTARYYSPAPLKVFGADGYHATAGTTNATTYDINKNGTTFMATKLSIASAATSGLGFTADDSTVTALSDYISIDCDSASTTAPIDAYIELFTMALYDQYLN